jgi:hypothetical protein
MVQPPGKVFLDLNAQCPRFFRRKRPLCIIVAGLLSNGLPFIAVRLSRLLCSNTLSSRNPRPDY